VTVELTVFNLQTTVYELWQNFTIQHLTLLHDCVYINDPIFLLFVNCATQPPLKILFLITTTGILTEPQKFSQTVNVSPLKKYTLVTCYQLIDGVNVLVVHITIDNSIVVMYCLYSLSDDYQIR